MASIPVFDKTKAEEQRSPSEEIYYPSSTKEIYYPERDGKPMGETDWHVTVIAYLLGALRYVFRHSADVYVAADMLFYYQEGEPSVFKVPDLYVVRGVSKQARRIYRLWEERVAPCAIFEITSRSTRWEDVAEKRGLYEFLAIREYFLFDPLGEYLTPRLQGFRLVDDRYQVIPLNPDGTITSQELGVILRPLGNFLRVVDPASGEVIPTLEEAAERAEEAAEQAEEAAERAEEAAERAEQARHQAQAEVERANAAEAELARLRAELERLQRRN